MGRCASCCSSISCCCCCSISAIRVRTSEIAASSAKKRKKHEKSKKKKRKKRERESADTGGHGARDVISGKRIKREEGQYADAEGQARREALLSWMNEGGDEAAAARPLGSEKESETSRLAREAQADPAKMRELIARSHAAQREKQMRLARLRGSGGEGSAEGPYSGSGAGGSKHRPRNYREERLARERSEDL